MTTPSQMDKCWSESYKKKNNSSPYTRLLHIKKKWLLFILYPFFLKCGGGLCMGLNFFCCNFPIITYPFVMVWSWNIPHKREISANEHLLRIIYHVLLLVIHLSKPWMEWISFSGNQLIKRWNCLFYIHVIMVQSPPTEVCVGRRKKAHGPELLCLLTKTPMKAK